MKKISIKKLRPKKEEISSRITNETVAEHRERILAGGRKFKYPIQYARHKLVLNAIFVVVAATALMLVLAWWQLYPMQNSSEFMYRLTRIVPVPVASVNGERVPYRDYLVLYRAQDYYLGKYGEINLDSTDGQRQLNYIKRQTLDIAEQIAYARQLAPKYHITISDTDVDVFINDERNTANGRVSQETYDASIQMLYGQTTDDYRLQVADGLLKNSVAFAFDTEATAQVNQAKDLVNSSGGDFAKVAEQMANSKGQKAVAGQSGMVDDSSKYGGLRVSQVATLGNGQISGVLKSATDDGYYFVKVLDKSDTQVNFAYLHIPLGMFNSSFAQLKSNGKVHEYITIASS